MPRFVSRAALFLMMVLLTLPASPIRAFAADGPTALQAGAWAVELALSIDESFEETSLALKRSMSDRSALRVGVGTFFNEQDLEGTVEDSSPVSIEDAAVKSTSSNWAVFLHYVRYGMISDRVATQFAIGPIVQVGRSASRQSFDIGTPTFQEFEFSNETKLYGLEFMLGVEWFFTSRLSLGGQAGVRGLTGDRETHDISRSGNGPTYQFQRQDLSGDASTLRTIGSRIALTGYL